MNVSPLSQAVLVQLLGFLLLMTTANPWLWLAGIIVVIIGGVMYRRERKRQKQAASTAASLENAPEESKDA